MKMRIVGRIFLKMRNIFVTLSVLFIKIYAVHYILIQRTSSFVPF